MYSSTVCSFSGSTLHKTFIQMIYQPCSWLSRERASALLEKRKLLRISSNISLAITHWLHNLLNITVFLFSNTIIRLITFNTHFKINIKGATKFYFMRYPCVVIILFKQTSGFTYVSILYLFFWKATVSYFCVSCLLCVLNLLSPL